MVAVAAKLEVEIWRRPKKSNFWPWFPSRSFRQFLAKTYRFATIQNITDRQQTDDSVPEARPIVQSAKNQNSIDHDNFCQLSINDCCLFITLSIQLCVHGIGSISSSWYMCYVTIFTVFADCGNFDLACTFSTRGWTWYIAMIADH